MNLNFERVFSFWARTAPDTPMQRIGALLMGGNLVLCSAVIVITIANASASAWTVAGVTSGAFGLGIVLLLLPTGMAHGLAAVFPQVFEPWRCEAIGRSKRLKKQFSDGVKDMYLVVGWFASIGIVVLLTYLLTLKLL
jgi:hypothetical protein